MSADKYPSIFSRQMEAIVYISSRQMEAIVYIFSLKIIEQFMNIKVKTLDKLRDVATLETHKKAFICLFYFPYICLQFSLLQYKFVNQT